MDEGHLLSAVITLAGVVLATVAARIVDRRGLRQQALARAHDKVRDCYDDAASAADDAVVAARRTAQTIRRARDRDELMAAVTAYTDAISDATHANRRLTRSLEQVSALRTDPTDRAVDVTMVPLPLKSLEELTAGWRMDLTSMPEYLELEAANHEKRRNERLMGYGRYQERARQEVGLGLSRRERWLRLKNRIHRRMFRTYLVREPFPYDRIPLRLHRTRLGRLWARWRVWRDGGKTPLTGGA